ncbi:hypothetical protein KIN20_007482 [Parelaphostrongylus tenuis]|uniref:Uncharacterized protein n=1 Tax=Parelaphostrongylus tenuis TaxID=148309 RepID=A0AAD5M6M8_PARTN|nr:hypothetical protein KIN20_007482 [Parelaphostrongylus tenuis]
MVYSTGTDVQTRVPGIATSEAGARGFVERLVMQTVLDVLESQGRSALLPDTVISTILRQLTVAVNYAPLMCAKVQLGSTDMTMREYKLPDVLEERVLQAIIFLVVEMMESGCIIFGSTVTGICTNTMMGGAAMRCMPPPPPPGGMVIIKPVSGPPLIISGSLSTANIIMANWSRTMWQNIVSRAVRMLASGPFGSHFFSATATVDGN